MSSKQNMGRDPIKRAEKRRRQRLWLGRGAAAVVGGAPQMTHASSGRAAKKRRDAEGRGN